MRTRRRLIRVRPEREQQLHELDAIQSAVKDRARNLCAGLQQLTCAVEIVQRVIAPSLGSAPASSSIWISSGSQFRPAAPQSGERSTSVDGACRKPAAAGDKGRKRKGSPSEALRRRRELAARSGWASA